AGHVFGVQFSFGWYDKGTIVGIQIISWYTGKGGLLVGEYNRRQTSDSRAAREIGVRVFWDSGARTNQTHMPKQHVHDLGKFIQLPMAQERPNGSEVLTIRCRNGGMLRVDNVN